MDFKKTIVRYKNKFLTLEQVVGVGRGFKEIGGERTRIESIQVMVEKKMPKSQLRSRDIVPRFVDGVPTDVIEIGRPKALGQRTERVRPAQPGSSIGHYLISAGTFGAVVYDIETGQPLILSNNHVLANTTSTRNKRAEIGDPILQPGSYDGGNRSNDVIGYLERYIPIDMQVSEQVCFIGQGIARFLTTLLEIFMPGENGMPKYEFKLIRRGGENLVDCAVAVPVSDDVINSEIIDIGEVKGLSKVELGDMVKKSGRTSGLTRGYVRSLDATVSVDMGNGGSAIFSDQIVIDAISQGGDSGSLVLTEDNKAVGLLFAGSAESTICNPILAVLSALKVRF